MVQQVRPEPHHFCLLFISQRISLQMKIIENRGICIVNFFNKVITNSSIIINPCLARQVMELNSSINQSIQSTILTRRAPSKARAWFLKIDLVRVVGMRVRVCVCVCVRARGY